MFSSVFLLFQRFWGLRCVLCLPESDTFHVDRGRLSYVVCFPEVWPRPPQSFWLQAPFTARGVAWYLELWMKPASVLSADLTSSQKQLLLQFCFVFFTRCHAAKLTFKWDSLKHYFLFFFLHFNVFTSAENLPDVMSRLTLSFAYARAKKKKKNTSQISSINLNRALMFAAWMRRRLRLQRLFPGIKTLNTWIFFVTPFA